MCCFQNYPLWATLTGGTHCGHPIKLSHPFHVLMRLDLSSGRCIWCIVGAACLLVNL